MLPWLFVFTLARCRCRHPAQTSLARRLCFTARGVAHHSKTIATAGTDRFTFVAVSFAIFASAAWQRKRAREMAELLRPNADDGQHDTATEGMRSHPKNANKMPTKGESNFQPRVKLPRSELQNADQPKTKTSGEKE